LSRFHSASGHDFAWHDHRLKVSIALLRGASVNSIGSRGGGRPDPYHLVLIGIEVTLAVLHAEDTAIDPSKPATSTARVGRVVLPKHPPHNQELIVPSLICV